MTLCFLQMLENYWNLQLFTVTWNGQSFTYLALQVSALPSDTWLSFFEWRWGKEQLKKMVALSLQAILSGNG